MKLKYLLLPAIALVATLLSSCDDDKSYSELLDEESKAINSFLASQRVINEIPADTVFETGEDAPFYKLDEEGNVYMQVVKAGDRVNNRAQTDQIIYFRFARTDLKSYEQGNDDTPEGNYADGIDSYYFRYNNYTLSSTTQYGAGIQMPLAFVGIDSEVNIIIKSKYGFDSEISSVIPFLWNVRYYKSKI